MQPANIIHHTQSQSFQPQAQKLQAGQIIHGTINKIFPNQTAEVQIGSQKLIASLDAPLKTGERYWLQVQPGEGRLHLKVLNNGAGKNESNGLKGAAEQLLAHLAVPQNKETTELAKFLLTNQLPITRETFDMSVQWLKTSENFTASLGNIKTMHARNLPFIDDVYSALQSLENGETFYSSITKLLGHINGKGTHSEALHTVKSLLEKMAAPRQFHLASNVLDKLMVNWLNPDIAPENQKSAYAILQKAGFIPLDFSEAEVIEKIILAFQSKKNQFPALLKDSLSLILQYSVAKQTGNPGAEKLLTVINRLKSNPGNITIESFQSLMANEESGLLSNGSLQEGLRPSSILRNPETVQLTKQLLETFLVYEAADGKTDRKPINPHILFSAVNGNGNLSEQASLRLARLIAGEMDTGRQNHHFDGSERQLLKEIIKAGDRPVDFTSGLSAGGFLKEIAKMLGANMEHFLASVGGLKSGAPNEELFTLKPMLMKLLAENQHPSIKEGAEQILNRITAQQILSQETGPLQHIFMQIPLALSGFHKDLTIQWSGRKKSDGTIDPNYCRVLFYLDLEQMQQTVIDVQIQNRVMKVTVINKNHELLEQLSRPLIKSLKDNIESMNYRLSSVVFEGEASKVAKQTARARAQNTAVLAGSKPYNGVDIRI